MARPDRAPITEPNPLPRSRLPWVLAGLLLAAAVGVALVFAVHGAAPAMVATPPPPDDAQRLADARRALQDARFDDARMLVQAISPDSPQAADAARLNAEIAPARTHHLFEQARDALARKDLDAARRLVDELRPLDAHLADELELELHPAQPAPQFDLGADRMPPDPRVRKALAAGFSLFAAGKLDAAAREFARLGQQHPDGTMRAAARSLAEATRNCQHATDARPTTVQPLILAVRSCNDVDPGSATVRQLKQRLASALVAQGDAAVASGRPLDAVESYRSADSVVAGSSAVPLEKLRTQAPALAAAARKQADPARARATWQALSLILPAEDPLRAEAQKALDGRR